MVMGLTNSPGLARLVLLHNAKENIESHPAVLPIMDKNTYMDDSGVFGDTEQEVAHNAIQVVDCLKKGSFQSGKILSDSKWVLKSLPEDTLHPAILNAVQNKEDFVTGVLGNPVLFNHPTIEDAVVKDAKQLGVHFEIDLGKEDS